MNILINAYACSPTKGSEPGMSWNWIVQLSKHYHLHVITEGEWKNELEEAIKKLPQGYNIKFHYNPVSDEIRKMCWNQGTWKFYYYYREWQKKTLKIAQNIIANNKIDIIHQLNMVGYREPGLLWKIKAIPKVWGPIGGFGEIPSNYLSLYTKSSATKQVLKQIINKHQPYLPYILNPIKKMDALVACNLNASTSLSRIVKKGVPIISEVGATQNLFNPQKTFFETPLQVAWIGKNDERKALPIAIEVFKQLRDKNIQLQVFGISKEEINPNSKLPENINFHGWLSHNEVQDKIQQCHLLLFTSLFEATGTAVLEALSMALPVLCHNTCGQGNIVTNKCGIKVDMHSIKYSIKKFTEHIELLNNDRNRLKQLSEGAIDRAHEISWEKNCDKMIHIYESVLKNT